MKRVLLEDLKKKMVEPVQKSEDPKQVQYWILIQYLVDTPCGYEVSQENQGQPFLMWR